MPASRRHPRRRNLFTAALLFALLAGLSPTLPAVADPHRVADEGPRPFSVHDLLAVDRLSSATVSPDGSQVAFVVRSTDLEADRGRTDLWLLDLAADGAPGTPEPRRLTSHEAGDHSPVWSADGEHLFFLSSRSGSSQVWRISPSGGEAEQVTELPLDVANLVVSPDGSRLAFSLDVYPDCETLECTVERLAEVEADPASARIYTDLLFRHWDTWDDHRRSHLFTVGLEEGRAKGEPVDLVAGKDADVPSQPFGGAEDFVFSPDGEHVVFVMRDAGGEEAWSTNFDLFKVPADGSAEPVNLTADNEAWDTGPVFSPDGAHLAWLAMARPGFEADRLRPRVMAVERGEVRDLAPDWDRSPSGLTWSADGSTLYATAADVGQVSLFAIDVASGEVETVLASGHVRSLNVLPPAGHAGGDAAAEGGADRFVFGLDTLTSPVELHAMTRGEEAPRPITDVNGELMAEVVMGEPEQFHFPGAGGERVYGYVVKPANFQKGERYPVAFLIHGGPQGSFGNDFHYRWNPQTYAGAGYAAVMIDFHGSVGYGQDFTDSIRGDWGGKPLVDLQKGLAAALQRYPWLDGERVCALGASYGGYMVNWIAGNWPDRFRCLVNHDGIFDNRMMYYATEELWFPEWEHLGPYGENPEGYERHNPANHVDAWRAPMLVIHGALDYRVPETQGFATFTALRRQGIPARFVYFADENHWVLQPSNSVLWHNEVNQWLDRWLGQSPEAGSEPDPASE